MQAVTFLFACLMTQPTLFQEDGSSLTTSRGASTWGNSNVSGVAANSTGPLTTAALLRSLAHASDRGSKVGSNAGQTVFTQFAAQEGTPVTSSATETPEKAAADRPSITDVAWIAGHWQGKAMGGSFEETWNPPFGGAMMGMFKFVENGEIKFYEILTIVQTKDSLLLRLKHFDKSLVGWEEKEESVEFPLVGITEGEVQFDGLTFKKVDDLRMLIVVKAEDGDKAQELEFDCRRVVSKKEQANE